MASELIESDDPPPIIQRAGKGQALLEEGTRAIVIPVIAGDHATQVQHQGETAPVLLAAGKHKGLIDQGSGLRFVTLGVRQRSRRR